MSAQEWFIAVVAFSLGSIVTSMVFILVTGPSKTGGES